MQSAPTKAHLRGSNPIFHRTQLKGLLIVQKTLRIPGTETKHAMHMSRPKAMPWKILMWSFLQSLYLIHKLCFTGLWQPCLHGYFFGSVEFESNMSPLCHPSSVFFTDRKHGSCMTRRRIKSRAPMRITLYGWSTGKHHLTLNSLSGRRIIQQIWSIHLWLLHK